VSAVVRVHLLSGLMFPGAETTLMRAYSVDSACEGSNCESDQGQDQQQEKEPVHGDASANRRYAEEHSENDRNESHVPFLRRAFSRLADHMTRASRGRATLGS
jgi:hypothetical protein